MVTYNYGQLERIWLDAGGPEDQMRRAAATAIAESGGNPLAAWPGTTIAPGQGSWDDATGLWQILGAPAGNWQASELTDPLDNAKMAVAKYQQGGNSWEAWTGDKWFDFYRGDVPPAKNVPGIKGSDAGKFSAGRFIAILKEAIGDPYLNGGDSPNGFDCSGLVYWALRKLGYTNVPRTSEEQWTWVSQLAPNQLRPGDLIFENFPGEVSPGHVLVWLGGGHVIQASSPGHPVAISRWSPETSGGTVVGYGRIPSMHGGGDGGIGTTGILSGIGDLGSALSSIADTFKKIEHAIEWFFVPSHWVRIFSGIGGAVFVMWGLWAISRTGRANSANIPLVGQVPVPEGGQLSPALGILAITIGSVGLFIAFHALPAEVSNVPTLMSYLQKQVKTGGGVKVDGTSGGSGGGPISID